MPTVGNVYEVPLIMEEFGLGSFLSQSLEPGRRNENCDEWYALWSNRMNSAPAAWFQSPSWGSTWSIPDSYMSVREALRHAAASCGLRAEVRWVHSEAVERDGPDEYLEATSLRNRGARRGFGPRGVEGMVETSRYARDKEVPYLGLCLGMQVMVIDWAQGRQPGCKLGELVGAGPGLRTPGDRYHARPGGGSRTWAGTMRLGQYPVPAPEQHADRRRHTARVLRKSGNATGTGTK